MRDSSPIGLRRIAGDPLTPLPILSFLEVSPSWSLDPTLDFVCVDGPASVDSLVATVGGNDGAVVLLDAALAVSCDRSWIACLRAEIGPVVVLGSAEIESSALLELDVTGCIPATFFDVPATIARAVLADHVRLEDRCAVRGRAELTEVGGGERFVRDAIHEFRTPLTIISEFVGLCEDGVGGPLTEKQAGYLGYVQSAVQRLCREFDDYRDTIRMQLGSLQFQPSSAPLERVLDAALSGTDIPVQRVDGSPCDAVLNSVEERRTLDAVDRVLRAAGKLSEADEPLRVRVTPVPGGHEISIAFIGRTPAPTDVEVMRRGLVESEGSPYRSVARVFGLGVAMARQFLQACGGDLRLDPLADGGALVLTIPTAAVGVAAA